MVASWCTKRRRSTGSREPILRRRSKQEREEWLQQQAVGGLDELGEEFVYPTVRALPAPNAPAMVDIPVNQELHDGRYLSGYHEYVLREMLPAGLTPDYKSANTLCRIKKGMNYVLKKFINGKKDK